MKITGYIMDTLDVFDREEVKIPGTTIEQIEIIE